MRLRATIEYSDGCADSIQIWPDAYTDVDAAKRWGEMVEKLTPGATFMDLEQECPTHGWEDLTRCEECAWPQCAKEVAEHGMCAGCYDDLPEAECLAPSGPGMCLCPNH